MVASRLHNIELAVHWQDRHAGHVDRGYLEAVDLAAAMLPGALAEQLNADPQQQTASQDFAAGELIPACDRSWLRAIDRSQFPSVLSNGEPIAPRLGRFYPTALLKGMPQDIGARIFRVMSVGAGHLQVDFNHPFCPHAATMTARRVGGQPSVHATVSPRRDVIGSLMEGPGIQAPLPIHDTDFMSGEPFSRADESDDMAFYRQPRFVYHLDHCALGHVHELYGRFLKPGLKVLDLMSSWISHLPDDVEDLQVTGHGLNQDELAANPRLDDFLVKDLNAEPVLPWDAETFDVVVCTVSVEYLTRPVAVFAEVARVLKPGGAFVVIFSDRWFPPKVVRIWTELHPFERLALVTHYFRWAGAFTEVHTESLRGWPRPSDDKYADQRPTSDPVFAVWGYRGEGR